MLINTFYASLRELESAVYGRKWKSPIPANYRRT